MNKSKVIPSIILFAMLAIVNIYSMKSVEFQGKHLFQLSIIPSYANTEMPCNDIKNCYEVYDPASNYEIETYKRVCEKPDGTKCNMYLGNDFDKMQTCCND